MLTGVLNTMSLDSLAFLSLPLGISFVGFIVAFHVLAPYFPDEKQTSWIITTISSAMMSLMSLPFLWDYLSNGGSVKHVQALPVLAIVANRFFQAYLTVDLVVGSKYYRSKISFLEGWIHHVVYLMVVELTIRRSWAHIFCLCASMEIPTFVLGSAILFPRLRNDTLFAISFFMTRISLHIALCVSYLSEDNRIHATEGSFIPAMLLIGILPLHVLWFVGCVKGFIRRASQKVVPTVEPHEVLDDAATASGVPVASTSGPFGSQNLRIRLVHRRQSFEKAIQSFRVDFLDSPSSKRVLISNAFSAYIPRRETVYDYVGLGKKRHQGFTTDEPVTVAVPVAG